MLIPEKLKVGGLIYDIKIVGEDLLRAEAGDITTNKKLIRILQADDDFMFITLLHEIFHALNMEMPEERIEFLAQGLFQVMVDNPEVFVLKEEKIEKKVLRKKEDGKK